MVLFGSVTLRESYEILFFMLSVYCGIKAHVYGKHSYFVWMACFSLLMGLFHHGLLLYSVIMVVIIFFWRIGSSGGIFSVSKSRMIAIVFAPIIIASILAVAPNIAGTEALLSLSGGQGLEFAEKFGGHNTDSRAAYSRTLDISSPLSFFVSSVVVLFNYLFRPFIWQIRNILDVYAVIEVLLRVVLIYFSLKAWRNACGSRQKLLALMLMIYFSMTFLWALGTSNYGTAMRHHLLSYWILIVLGVPPLLDSVRKFSKRYLINKDKPPALPEGV